MIQLGPHPEGRAHVVMVTSASTGDGKTTSAVNLAAAAAASGDPVILLDFDLRKPDVGRTLGVQPGTELTGLLQPDTQLRDLLSPAPGLPALSVLTTTVAEGDVALVEALSRRLPELIADARELCNYVVIDTAPIGEISDALRLVSDVDSIIVVTKPGQHQPRELRDDARPPRAHRVHAGRLPGDRRLHAAHERLLRLRGHRPRALPAGAHAGRRDHTAAPGTHEVCERDRLRRQRAYRPSDRHGRRRPDRVGPRTIERESSGPRNDRESTSPRAERDRPDTRDEGTPSAPWRTSSGPPRSAKRPPTTPSGPPRTPSAPPRTERRRRAR